MYSALRVTLGHETLNQLVDLCGKGSQLLLLLPAAGAVELRSLLCLSSLLFLPLGKQATFHPISGTMHPAMDGPQANTSRLMLIWVTTNARINLPCK